MNKKRFETFISILQGVQTLAMIYALTIGVLWYVKGKIWFKSTIIPFHTQVFLFLLIPASLLAISMAPMKAYRPYAGHMLYQMAYFSGGLAWFYAANYCLTVLGKFLFIFGSCVIGVGLLPIAVAGSIIKGHWPFLGFLCLQLTVAGGCWFLAAQATSTSGADRTG